MEPKRLYRSIEDRKIAGVAGGFGTYLNIDPLLVRLIFVLLTLAGGGGLLLYIILWILIPDQPLNYARKDNFAAQPDPETPPAYESTGYENYQTAADAPPADPARPTQVQPKKERGSMIGGLVLITIGSLFLADEFFPEICFQDYWPVILIAIGIGLLFNGLSRKRRETQNN